MNCPMSSGLPLPFNRNPSLAPSTGRDDVSACRYPKAEKALETGTLPRERLEHPPQNPPSPFEHGTGPRWEPQGDKGIVSQGFGKFQRHAHNFPLNGQFAHSRSPSASADEMRVGRPEDNPETPSGRKPTGSATNSYSRNSARPPSQALSA